MTGYATARAGRGSGADSTAPPAAALTAELRSVNGRFLDLALRLPDELRTLEPALREALSGAFRRGKIELRLATARDADQDLPQPRPAQLQRLAQLQDQVQAWMPKAPALSTHEVLQWCRGTAPAAVADEAALAVVRQAIERLREARAREGERLVAVLAERIATLRALAAQAEPLVPAVVQRQRERFLERWREALSAAGGAPATAEAVQERALAEAAAYALRIDVAEELSRLRAHLDEIARLLDAGGEVGKRLDFLIQELHREANTLGSKASALELTAIAVEMKVAIEQMREQVQNLE